MVSPTATMTDAAIAACRIRLLMLLVRSREFSEVLLLSGHDAVQPPSFVAELGVIRFKSQPCGFFLRQSARCLLQFRPDPLQLLLSGVIILLHLL